MLLLRASAASAIVATLLSVVSAVAHAAPVFGVDPWRLCPEAIASQERQQGIPKHLLSAIALAESARTHPTFGKRMPWPWTVMAEGQGRYLPTKAAAIAEVRELQARGIRNIDVGCMQVNLYYHADAFTTLDDAFDPPTNVSYAAQFLRELYADAGSWQEATGFYHSATPELRIPYRDRVIRFWNDQQRLEFAGNTTFGVGPLTAGAGAGSGSSQRVRSPALMLSLADRQMAGPRKAMGEMQAPDDRRSAAAPQLRTAQGQPIIPARSLDEEAAFAARRAQYLQELRRAIAEVKRSYAVRVASNSDAPAAAAAAR